MIIVPNRINIPIDLSQLEISSTRNYLIKFKLFHDYYRLIVVLKRDEIPVAYKSRKSGYTYYGYTSDLTYAEICVPTKASTESLDAFFKEQGERYCQAKLMKTLS